MTGAPIFSAGKGPLESGIARLHRGHWSAVLMYLASLCLLLFQDLLSPFCAEISL